MDNLDRLIALRDRGMRTEGLGPEQEWHPVSDTEHQIRHNRFWAGVVSPLLADEPGEYDDLPSWMTEDATDLLTKN
jgi:hypothetical protein